VRTALFDGDLRTDLPAYTVYVDGEPVDRPDGVCGVWRDDLVAFLIGCSLTFKAALVEAGCRCGTLERGGNVAMYRTGPAA